jgi:hypothetical protein
VNIFLSGGSDLQDKVFKIVEESSDDTELSVPLNIRKPAGQINDTILRILIIHD